MTDLGKRFLDSETSKVNDTSEGSTPHSIARFTDLNADPHTAVKNLFVVRQIVDKIQKVQDDLDSHFRPPQERLFMTRQMDNKLSDIHQHFCDAKKRLHLDFRHKPYFVDLNPQTHLVTINGVPYRNESDEFYMEQYRVMEESNVNLYYDMMHYENTNSASMAIYVIIVISIIVSVIATIAASIPDFEDEEMLWFTIECIVTICFTIEYLVKLFVVRDPIRYVLRIMNVFDLLAIVPFYISLLPVGADAIASAGGVLRALRLARIAKIRQLASPYTTIIIASTVDSIKGAGSAAVIFLFIACVMTGTLVFAFENPSDEGHPGYTNIPLSMWFSLVTMSTVGYGDMYPMTWIGQLLGVVTILVGMVLSSLIIMVVGQYYINNVTKYTHELKKIKEELFNAADGDIDTYRRWLRFECPNFLYRKIATQMRKRAERKKKWWWSKFRGPNEEKTTYTYRSNSMMRNLINPGYSIWLYRRE